jgi:hypothetical protein
VLLLWSRSRFLLGALACLLPATVARAYEDQLALGLGAGYAHALSSAPASHGVLFDLTGGAGLSPAWTVRGRFSYAFHPAEQPLHVALAGAELLYLFDVVELVPYFGAGLDGVSRARAGHFEVDAAAHLVVGLDYLLSRDFILGLDLRSHVLVTALDRDPIYVALTASAVWLFEE